MTGMNEALRDIEIKMTLSLQRQMITDDLLEENDVYFFEKKRKWLLQWEEQMTKRAGYEPEMLFLSLQDLKEAIVALKNRGIDDYRKQLFERCCNFRPYYRMPGWDEKELCKMKINTSAQELTLEKICILLGMEEDRFRTIQRNYMCTIDEQVQSLI